MMTRSRFADKSAPTACISAEIPPRFATQGDFSAPRHSVEDQIVRIFHYRVLFLSLAGWRARRSPEILPLTYRSCGRAATIALAVAALCLGLSQNAAAATASELFADGNRLFRDDLYWAALLRFQQASEAGMDTPLLHYNTGAQFHLSFGDRFDLDATAAYRIYNYENAFAFHEPAAGRKTLESAIGTAAATFRMTDTLSLVGEYRYRDVVSSDTRIEYARSLILLSVRWVQ